MSQGGPRQVFLSPVEFGVKPKSSSFCLCWCVHWSFHLSFSSPSLIIASSGRMHRAGTGRENSELHGCLRYRAHTRSLLSISGYLRNGKKEKNTNGREMATRQLLIYVKYGELTIRDSVLSVGLRLLSLTTPIKVRILPHGKKRVHLRAS